MSERDLGGFVRHCVIGDGIKDETELAVWIWGRNYRDGKTTIYDYGPRKESEAGHR